MSFHCDVLGDVCFGILPSCQLFAAHSILKGIEDCSFGMAYQLQRSFRILTDVVFQVSCQMLCHVAAQQRDVLL